MAMTAGRSWGIFLVTWFAAASLASRIGRARKALATEGIVAKGGRRDATQVLANGGAFACCALLAIVFGDHALPRVVGAASLVAAGADTLATETGTLWRGQPFSLKSFGRVPSGTSGAVSLAGTAGLIGGAVLFALAAQFAGLIRGSDLFHVTLGGIAGAVADTLIGAWWQARRWCPSCTRETEQHVHRCGTLTQPWRGITWLDNDRVNFACTVVGAATVVLLKR